MPSIPIQNRGTDYIYGLELESENPAIVNLKQINVQKGAARDSKGIYDIELNGEVKASILASGVNGIDAGVVTADSTYSVFLIGDTKGDHETAVTMSLDQFNPQLPFGYDVSRRIGQIWTDTLTDIIKFFQFGRDTMRYYEFDEQIPVLVAGASDVWANVFIENRFPLRDIKLIVNATYTPAFAESTFHIKTLDSRSTDGPHIWGGGAVGVDQNRSIQFLTTRSRFTTSLSGFQYKVTAGDTLYLSVTGFYDDLLTGRDI